MIKTLYKCIGEYKKSSLLCMITVICETVLEIYIPLLMASLIDKGIEANNINEVLKYGAMMLGCACLTVLFGYLAGNNAAKASTGFARNIRKREYEQIQTFSFSNIDKFSAGGLITRLTTDVSNVQNAYQMIVRTLVRSPINLICALTMAFIISKRLSVIFVAAIVFLLFALGTIIVCAMKYFRQLFPKYDLLNESIQENVGAVRVVKSFVREDYEKEKFKQKANDLAYISKKAESVLAFNNPSMMFAVYFCILMLSWFGAKFIVVGDLTTGQLTSLFSYVMNILMSLMMLSMVFVMITMSIESANRIVEVINEESDIVSPENPVMEVKNGDIEFKNVNFAYKYSNGDPILKDINLKINSGETIGIIGPTGSSKSSFVSLISRLYDVTSGELLVGDINVKDYDLVTLRDKVSVVLQNNVLFSGTILDNLRWGNKNATEEECKEACALACADEFINRFEDGYNTYIEQGGTNVSGGQKQRLCIARALLKEPKVLILDDSTSAVDTATDAAIQEAFKTKIPDVTKIIISQRISSVQSADRIIVLDDGAVTGFDTHENLLKSNEIYQDIYTLQTSGKEEK